MFLGCLANEGHVALVSPHRANLLVPANQFVSSKAVWRGLGRPKLMCKYISKLMCKHIFLKRYVCQHCVAFKTGKRFPFLCFGGIQIIDETVYLAICW